MEVLKRMLPYLSAYAAGRRLQYSIGYRWRDVPSDATVEELVWYLRSPYVQVLDEHGDPIEESQLHVDTKA